MDNLLHQRQGLTKEKRKQEFPPGCSVLSRSRGLSRPRGLKTSQSKELKTSRAVQALRSLQARRDERLTGFTLVEILITIFVFSLVILSIFDIYAAGMKFYHWGDVQAELLQNGRVILERMTREIRQAEEIVTSLPQVPDSPENPPAQEIEFQDGHTPSPYEALGSDYYYIRYYIPAGTQEVHRQYRVYCFDPCETCVSFFRWNDSRMVDEDLVIAQPCDLEDKVIGEYVAEQKFWGAGLVNILFTLNKHQETMQLKTNVYGRNL